MYKKRTKMPSNRIDPKEIEQRILLGKELLAIEDPDVWKNAVAESGIKENAAMRYMHVARTFCDTQLMNRALALRLPFTALEILSGHPEALIHAFFDRCTPDISLTECVDLFRKVRDECVVTPSGDDLCTRFNDTVRQAAGKEAQRIEEEMSIIQEYQRHLDGEQSLLNTRKAVVHERQRILCALLELINGSTEGSREHVGMLA